MRRGLTKGGCRIRPGKDVRTSDGQVLSPVRLRAHRCEETAEIRGNGQCQLRLIGGIGGEIEAAASTPLSLLSSLATAAVRQCDAVRASFIIERRILRILCRGFFAQTVLQNLSFSRGINRCMSMMRHWIAQAGVCF